MCAAAVSPMRPQRPASIGMATARSSPVVSPAAFAKNPWSSTSSLHAAAAPVNGAMTSHHSQVRSQALQPLQIKAPPCRLNQSSLDHACSMLVQSMEGSTCDELGQVPLN